MVGEIFIYWSKSHVSPYPYVNPHPHKSLPPPPLFLSPEVGASSQSLGLSPTLLPHQNFKREEQNFVVQNEINNMSFLTADNKSKMAKVSA